MKTKIYHIIFTCTLAITCTLISCSDFLDVTPKGMVTKEGIFNPEDTEKMVTSAYSELGNDHYQNPNSNWPHGNVRSDDAHKGGDGLSDSGDYHGLDVYNEMRATNGWMDYRWWKFYVGISRVHRAMEFLNGMSESDYPNKHQRIAEMRFLRGWYTLQLKLIWKYFPYVDETMDEAEYKLISNRQYSNNELWSKIAEDFKAASEGLPDSQKEPGRPTKFAAKAFYGKTLLYQAYEQDESHQVTKINTALLEQVVLLMDEVIQSKKYGLFEDFGYNFIVDYDNGKESIFAIQRSMNDGTGSGRIDGSSLLNHPIGPYGCCGFHIPSQNLVNVFQTSNEGLPLFDTFNNYSPIDPVDFKTHNIDPRLDHTVGIPEHIWKYDNTTLYDKSWARAPQVYGHYSSMKEVMHYKCDCFKKVPPFMSSTKNTVLMRYADVLLFKAEALIELNRPQEALELINMVRRRASDSRAMIAFDDNTYASTYKIGEYKPGENCTWNQDFARKALRFERRLEFAMEGYRFFDLVRWGVADEVINKYLEVEKTRREYYKTAKFTKGRDEYLPIPQSQINYSEGNLIQNSKYE
ncbi:RagB/SusD family nutrient uptake outer membrane protein [Prevotella sp. 10(H)]|uniref:RagB/SusD family nutrient uptake outer membrane protein n=1 Tax=Prevotella sp. 10(H) TaxID=1158294 RepID=UPI0004A6AFC4|nr:RagB/SusD family nutrient uptake outer membrane protein [Prevotella sp. 10(H)]